MPPWNVAWLHLRKHWC